jgi:hypothetical protein
MEKPPKPSDVLPAETPDFARRRMDAAHAASSGVPLDPMIPEFANTNPPDSVRVWPKGTHEGPSTVQ